MALIARLRHFLTLLQHSSPRPCLIDKPDCVVSLNASCGSVVTMLPSSIGRLCPRGRMWLYWGSGRLELSTTHGWRCLSSRRPQRRSVEPRRARVNFFTLCWMAQTSDTAAEVFPGITMDPQVRFGKPCIAGTRVDVATLWVPSPLVRLSRA